MNIVFQSYDKKKKENRVQSIHEKWKYKNFSSKPEKKNGSCPKGHRQQQQHIIYIDFVNEWSQKGYYFSSIFSLFFCSSFSLVLLFFHFIQLNSPIAYYMDFDYVKFDWHVGMGKLDFMAKKKVMVALFLSVAFSL